MFVEQAAASICCAQGLVHAHDRHERVTPSSVLCAQDSRHRRPRMRPFGHRGLASMFCRLCNSTRARAWATVGFLRLAKGITVCVLCACVGPCEPLQPQAPPHPLHFSADRIRGPDGCGLGQDVWAHECAHQGRQLRAAQALQGGVRQRHGQPQLVAALEPPPANCESPAKQVSSQSCEQERKPDAKQHTPCTRTCTYVRKQLRGCAILQLQEGHIPRQPRYLGCAGVLLPPQWRCPPAPGAQRAGVPHLPT